MEDIAARSVNGSQSLQEPLSEENRLEKVFDTVIAISNYDASDETQLSFKRGECIRVVDRVNEDWLWGDINGVLGYVPSNHVKDLDEVEQMQKWQDEEYFESYYHMRLHLEMLGDKPRTEAYRTAVIHNSNFVQHKTVLDVGSGTGILSMFCAREGKARKVYAVEASSLADHITDVLQENNLEQTITVIKGRVETITLPEKVDIIISEWMGTFLLFEYMIDSVIYARDHWLKPGGVMWPTLAQLFIFPCNAEELYHQKVGVWKQQYGFSFSTLKQKAVEDFFDRPIIDHELLPSDYLSDPMSIAKLDMNAIDVVKLESWSCDFKFVVNKVGNLHGFGSWFDVEFHSPLSMDDDLSANTPKPVILSTSPNDPKTHWKNAVFVLDEPVKVAQGNVIQGMVQVIRNAYFRRHMTIHFDFGIFENESNNCSASKYVSKEFKLWR